MPFYMLQGSFKEEQMKALVDRPRNREAVARDFIESFGGKLHQYFLAFGEHDVVVIAEYPDNETASAAALKTLSTGVFSKAQTTVLMTGAEAERSMKKANTTKTAYKPPAG